MSAPPHLPDSSQPSALADVLGWLADKPTSLRAGQAVRKIEDLIAAGAVPMRRITLAYVRNFTIEPIETALKLDGFRAGLHVEPAYSGYDPQPDDELVTLVEPAHVVVVGLRLEDLSSALTSNFLATPRDGVDQLVVETVDRVLSMVAAVRERSSAAIVVHNFIAPTHAAAGLADSQDVRGQVNLVRRANLALAAAVAELAGVTLLDVDRAFSVVGLRSCYDPRGDRMADAPLSQVGLAAMSQALVRHLSALQGPRVKCVVVDCDNTLWGGVIGEDGLSGIQLDRTGPGRRFRDLQLELRDLRHRGVALAIASHNEESDVLDVLRTHPDCVLSTEDFAAIRINWDDKADSISAIAEELNLGLGQVAFIDDDPLNCDRIRTAHPEVKVLAWPDDLAEGERLDDLGWFDSLVITEEDRRRTSMYRAETARREARGATASPEDYLRSLELVATVGEATPAHVARLAQLTQRTNQFNLTTRRYDVGTIQALADAPSSRVIWLDLADRFGAYGIVGAAILNSDAGVAVIDTFLMSCRVLGRRVEAALIAVVAERARAMGASTLVGEYVPSERNQQVADLYDRLGFTRIGPVAGTARWEWTLDRDGPARPEWIRIVDTGIEAQ